jgi:hypothetical protein
LLLLVLCDVLLAIPIIIISSYLVVAVWQCKVQIVAAAKEISSHIRVIREKRGSLYVEEQLIPSLKYVKNPIQLNTRVFWEYQKELVMQIRYSYIAKRIIGVKTIIDKLNHLAKVIIS